MTVIGKGHPRVDGPLKVTGTGPVRLRSQLSRHALRRAGRCHDRQRHRRRPSIPPVPGRCRACAPSSSAATWARSLASRPSFADAAYHGRAAAAVRGRRRPLLRPVRGARGRGHLRAGQGGRRRGARDLHGAKHPTSIRTSSPRRPRSSASAATPMRASPARRSRSTRTTGSRRRRTTRSRPTRPSRSGTATS